jgi:tetratricopeptide (TPR) repeat protein
MRPPPSPEQLARNKRMIIAAAAIIFGSNGNALRPMQSRSVDIRLEPYAVSSLVSREIVISDRAEIEAAGGSHLWSQEFDRELTDVFAVQDEIAKAVVAALKLKLLPASGDEPRTSNPGAHDQYLLGRYFVGRGSSDSYFRATQALEKAVELDPGYAAAWAALAVATWWASDQAPSGLDPEQGWPRAVAAAEKAIALAPNLADGHAARGMLRIFILFDWPGARADLERASALSPGSAYIILRHGRLLSTLGQLQEAIAIVRKATALDPLSAESWVELSQYYLGTGQFDLVEAAAQRALEVSPEHARAARNLGFARLLAGRPEEARAAFSRSTLELYRLMGEVLVDHALGRQEQSRRALDAVLALLYVAASGGYQVAQMYAFRGEADQAFWWLESAYKHHDAGLTIVKYDPLLRGVRGDPRFAAFLRKMHLPVD